MNSIRTIFLSLALLIAGSSWGQDFDKGVAAAQSGDWATVLKEWVPLAEQGDFRAQYNLGQMYRDGQGIPQDYKTAIKWFTLSAEQGHVDAQYNLGLMYGLGQGVLQDYVYAHMWGNIAASNGDENGSKLRDAVAKEMTAAQIEKAEQLAQECVRNEYKGC